MDEDEILSRCAAAWGTVYGIARLAAFEQIPGSVRTDVDDLVRTALDALFAGWQKPRPNRPVKARGVG